MIQQQRQPWHFNRRVKEYRFAELDRLSRQRALSDAESREMERLMRSGFDRKAMA